MTDEDLNQKLACVFEGVGRQVGELVRCLVQSEIASHTARIQQLQAALTGPICTTATSANAVGGLPAP